MTQGQQSNALQRAGVTAIRLAREGDDCAAEVIRAQQARIAELERWQEDVRSNSPLLAELQRANARVQELEASESRTIAQRDHCEEVIDRMADAVLGKDRHEWTSNYDYMDAAQEVEDRVAELEAQLEAIGAGGVEPLRKQAEAPQAVQPDAPVVLGWVLRGKTGLIGNHFYTYEPHCDAAVRDDGGEKIAVIAATAHPAEGEAK